MKILSVSIVLSTVLSAVLLVMACSSNANMIIDNNIDNNPSANNIDEYHITDSLRVVSSEKDRNLKLELENTNGNKIYVDMLEVPNDLLELNYAFPYITKDQRYIVFGLSYDEDYRDINKPHINWDKYYLTKIYKCDVNYHCSYDEKLSNFFGDGGDLVNFESNQVLSAYIYKNPYIVKELLHSNFFYNWLSGNSSNAYIITNSLVKELPYYHETTTDNVVKGTEVSVVGNESDWLEINYTKDNQKLHGWIECENTDICGLIDTTSPDRLHD